MMWATNTAPSTTTISGVFDWLMCDGTSHSTTTFSDLFGVIGTTFGGSGSVFNVPDFRTFYPVGVGSGFSLGTSTSASADSGTNVLKGIPINFIIKT
jgi:microcystin-dependent protein